MMMARLFDGDFGAVLRFGRELFDAMVDGGANALQELDARVYEVLAYLRGDVEAVRDLVDEGVNFLWRAATGRFAAAGGVRSCLSVAHCGVSLRSSLPTYDRMTSGAKTADFERRDVGSPLGFAQAKEAPTP
jgi:hypothetical protein